MTKSDENGTQGTEPACDQQDVIRETQGRNIPVNFATFMNFCHLKHSELATHLQNCKERVVLRGDKCQNESGCKAVFTGCISFSSGSRKRLRHLISSFGIAGEANDAVSACNQVKMIDAPDC